MREGKRWDAGRPSVHWAVCFSSVVSWCWIFGTSFSAARTLDAEPLLATAAFTCISRASQYPLGSAQAGTGWSAALATAGLALCSAAVSTWVSPAVTAELTVPRAAMRPFPWPCFQVRYCWLQLTGGMGVPDPWLAGAALGAAEWLHAVSPMTAAPAAARARHFI